MIIKTERNSSNPRDRSPIKERLPKNMHESEGNNTRSRERDRHRRGDRPSRFQDRSPSGDRDRGNRRAPADKRVYISNIPYEFRWQDLKDLFRTEVGEVEYVELFADEGEKPRGCGIIEFSSIDSVKKAIEKMHRFEVRGRKLVVKEDIDMERDPAGRLLRESMMSRSTRREEPPRSSRWNDSPRPSSPNQKGWGFTYGLSIPFLESLGIKGPLVNRVFVANLDYKVDEKKLQEVFKLAGKVQSAELNKDKDGKSRGHGVVEFEHPVEAVQSISMLHHQMLFDRLLTVRMDRVNEKAEGQPPKLPEGLRGIGMGLGEGGKALQDVSRSLPANLQNAQMQSMSMGGGMQNNLNNPSMTNLANQAALTVSGLAGLGNLQTSGGMGFGGSSVGGMMGGGLGGNLSANLGGLGGSVGGLGSLLGQGNSDMGLGLSLGSGGLSGGLSGMGSSSLGVGGLGGNLSSSSLMGGGGGSGYGNSGGGMGGSSSYGSSGMNPISGSYMGSGNSTGFGMGSSNTGSGNYGGGGRNFDMQAFSNNDMDNRDFRGNTNFNNGPIKMESNSDRNIKPIVESDTVVVRNLAPTSTWQMLRDKFRDVGDVKFAEIRNKDTGLVRFATPREAQRACDLLDRSRFDGRMIDVILY